jgi:hypothetical protein
VLLFVVPITVIIHRGIIGAIGRFKITTILFVGLLIIDYKSIALVVFIRLHRPTTIVPFSKKLPCGIFHVRRCSGLVWSSVGLEMYPVPPN